jgi:hypothetical protein
MIRRWSWIRACSTGSWHLKTGAGCQDFAACIETTYGDTTALIAVVSDGAGSARSSAIGSRAVVDAMVRRLARTLRNAPPPPTITEKMAHAWLCETRKRISTLARNRHATTRDFAATLVAAAVLPSQMIVCHVGDGACVARRQGKKNWEVVSWPAQGQYASTTFFVTDKPSPRLRFTCLNADIVDLAVFSDGLERLALDFAAGAASNRFFDPMTAPLRDQPAGHDRRLSGHLRRFLDSPRVVQRTDDDKSLIVARRTSARSQTDEVATTDEPAAT